MTGRPALVPICCSRCHKHPRDYKSIASSACVVTNIRRFVLHLKPATIHIVAHAKYTIKGAAEGIDL